MAGAPAWLKRIHLHRLLRTLDLPRSLEDDLNPELPHVSILARPGLAVDPMTVQTKPPTYQVRIAWGIGRGRVSGVALGF